MAEQENWQERSGKGPIIDADQLREIKGAIQGISLMWPNVLDHIKRDHFTALNGEFKELAGNTLSAGSLFGAWDVITRPEMVRTTELQWLYKLVKFGNRVVNSLMGNELDGENRSKETAEQTLTEMPQGAMITLSRFNRAISNISYALPPQAEQGIAS